jgi:hypothetical protein
MNFFEINPFFNTLRHGDLNKGSADRLGASKESPL